MQTGCQNAELWAKLWVKSIKTYFEFVEKLFNLYEKVIRSFLTMIAKNKLDGKGTYEPY